MTARTTRLVMLFTLAVLVSSFVAWNPVAAQEAAPATSNRPVPFIDFKVNLGEYDQSYEGIWLSGLNAESNDRNAAGKPDPAVPYDSRRYYYLPLMLFQEDNGTIRAEARDDGQVIVPILISTPTAEKAFHQHLLDNGFIGKGAGAGQIQVVPIKRFLVETEGGSSGGITLAEESDFVFPGDTYDLRATLGSRQAAERLVEDIRSGGTTVKMTVVFEGFAVLENNVVISYQTIRETNTFKNLNGDGGRGSVSRRDASEIIKDAADDIGITITQEFTDPELAQTVDRMLGMLETKTDTLEKGFGELLTRFEKQYAFDPNDLKADLIQSYKLKTGDSGEDLKKWEEHVKDEIEKGRSGGGGFSFGGFGVNANGAKTDKHLKAHDAVRETFKKWAITHEEEQDGEVFMPKTIEVYAKNLEQFKDESSIRYGKRKKFVGAGLMTQRVLATRRKLAVGVGPASLAERVARLEELRLEGIEHIATTQALDSQGRGYWASGGGKAALPLTEPIDISGPCIVVATASGTVTETAVRYEGAGREGNAKGVPAPLRPKGTTVHVNFKDADGNRRNEAVLYRANQDGHHDDGGWREFTFTGIFKVDDKLKGLTIGPDEPGDGDWYFHSTRIQVIVIPIPN